MNHWTELEFPTLRQFSDWDCGDAGVLCAVLAYYGIEVREDWIVRLARSNQRKGTNAGDILRVLRYYGLPFRAGRMTVPMIRAAIDRYEPVILTLQAYGNPASYKKSDRNGHWVTAIGYLNDWIKFHDSASYCHTWLAVEELRERWHDMDAKGKRLVHWGCIVSGRPVFRRNKIVHMD